MYLLKRFLSIIFRVFAGIILGALFIISLQYAVAPVYDFPAATKFSGDKIFNPYQKLRGNWYKANFHAHSREYGGLTDGRKNSPEEIYTYYRERGYGVISLSNYHSVYRYKAADERFFPAYEHGYNIFKTHQIVLSPEAVTWYDIPLPQSVHHKQFILNRIRSMAPGIILAHPKFVRGYTFDDLARLTNYDAIEVLNHYRTSDQHWDAALSAGNYAPVIGNDDTHDISNPGETGVCWTYLNAPSDSIEDVIAAIREGRTFGVTGMNAEMDNFPREVAVNDHMISIEMDSMAREIRFIGDGGTIRQTVKNAYIAQYEMMPDDSYIRIEVITPKTHMYMNPLVRTKTGAPEKKVATINWPLSLLYWMAFAAGYTLLVWLMYRRYKRKKIPQKTHE